MFILTDHQENSFREPFMVCGVGGKRIVGKSVFAG